MNTLDKRDMDRILKHNNAVWDAIKRSQTFNNPTIYGNIRLGGQIQVLPIIDITITRDVLTNKPVKLEGAKITVEYIRLPRKSGAPVKEHITRFLHSFPLYPSWFKDHDRVRAVEKLQRLREKKRSFLWVEDK